MTAIARKMIPEIATKVQVAIAACAITVAAAVPAVVANAEPIVSAPIAPVTQVLGSAPILGPVEFAEQNLGWWLLPGSNGQSRTEINTFSALILAAAGIFILPVAAFFAAVAAFVGIFFQIGPYGTGRS
jgi:hypothetical protein